MIIIGHRGARNEAPENTQVGFEHLRSLGINHVELDVRLSADKKLVVLHDTTLDRTTNLQGKVSEYTAEQMAKCDAGYHYQQKAAIGTNLDIHKGGVPLLDDVIEDWPALKSIQLEVKTTDKASLIAIADRLNFLIEAHQIHNQAMITSSDTEMLRIVANRHRHIQRGFVAERLRRDPIGVCLNLGCTTLVADWRGCSEQLIQRAHDEGIMVSVWTVNKISIARKLFHWGVDSLITDEPSKMLKAFAFQ